MYYGAKLVTQKDGQAALTAVVLFLIISVAIAFGFSSMALREARTARVNFGAKRSYFLTEAGQEDAIYRIVTGRQLSSQEIITINAESATTTITEVGNDREITSIGRYTGAVRKIISFLESPVLNNVSFPYGAQVGDGGIQMNNNARIEGNVYSNGNIIGAVGATITGEVSVAMGTSSAVNQSWTTQNTDVPVGVNTGSSFTAVDSAGELGTYNSLAMGPDGFARISYINDDSDDLKFARCLNNDCTSRVTTIVDSAGSIDKVTSLTLDQNGFGQISYYHDGNDDLKFTQCTNNDCTTRNIVTIDSAGNMGDFSAIAMGLDGFPRIAYWDDTNKDVRYARCTNASCSSRLITIVATAGNIGEYISLAIGSDGFGRITYYNATNQNLTYARCTNDNCSSAVFAVVDSSPNVGRYTSIKLGSDGFARISYYNVSGGDLRFARCLDIDCSTKNIATIDSAGTVGQYTSLALGGDGFARIAYFDESEDDLKFVRCTNADCMSSIITRVDSVGSVGNHTSLGFGPDGFGRISYHDATNQDLKFVRCADADCSPSEPQIDVAQSFQPTITDRVTRIDLYLKKAGSPQNAMLRLITDSGGRPSSSASNVLATTTIAASQVGTAYSWVSFYFITTPTISANTPYWIVMDSTLDNANYFVWGGDSTLGYTRGAAKRSADWTGAVWSDIVADLNFRVYMNGDDHFIRAVAVNSNTNAHIVDAVTVGGNANTFLLSNSTVIGNANAHLIENCAVGGNAAYNVKTNCTVTGSQASPTTPPNDPPALPLPIATTTIAAWKNEAAAGGTCIAPQCASNGDYDPSPCTVSLGPQKITGNLSLDANCPDGQELTVTGTIWVVGAIDISNNAKIKLSAAYGSLSGVIIADGTIHLSNNGQFSGSGTSGSYLMLLSTALGGGHHDSAIDLHNNATGAIFYAGNGLIYLHNNVVLTNAVANRLFLDNNARLTYNLDLANVVFSTGPSGGTYNIRSWKEVE